MARWTPAVVAATPGWWFAGALMQFASAVAACPSLRSLGTYPPAFRWVAASCRCRTHTFVLGSRVLQRVDKLSTIPGNRVPGYFVGSVRECFTELTQFETLLASGTTA